LTIFSLKGQIVNNLIDGVLITTRNISMFIQPMMSREKAILPGSL